MRSASQVQTHIHTERQYARPEAKEADVVKMARKSRRRRQNRPRNLVDVSYQYAKARMPEPVSTRVDRMDAYYDALGRQKRSSPGARR